MIYLIIIVGLILRLISINQSLWLDEATSALVAKMPIVDIFTKFLPGDFHPPLYYLILKAWTACFGFSEVSLRFPSIIFGLGTIYFTYLLAKNIFNKKIGYLSAILLATSGLSVYYSQEARMYSLAAFFVTVLVYAFIKKKWIVFSIVLPLLAMTDYVSLLILPVFWIVGKKDWRKLLIAHVPLLVVFSIWFPIFYRQLITGFSIQGSSWWYLLGTTTFKNIVLIPVKFVLGRISFDNKVLYGVIVTVVGSLYGFVVYKARKSSNLILSWLFVPVLVGIFLSFKIPTLSYFRFLLCLPALYILAAMGLEKTGRKKNLWIFILISINLLSTFYYLLTPRFQREDWRMAAKVIGTDVVVLPTNSQSEALKYYGLSSQIVYITNFTGDQKEIWLSRYVWQTFDPEDTARKKIELLGYNKVAEHDFNGVLLFKYQRNNYAYKYNLLLENSK